MPKLRRSQTYVRTFTLVRPLPLMVVEVQKGAFPGSDANQLKFYTGVMKSINPSRAGCRARTIRRRRKQRSWSAVAKLHKDRQPQLLP